MRIMLQGPPVAPGCSLAPVQYIRAAPVQYIRQYYIYISIRDIDRSLYGWELLSCNA